MSERFLAIVNPAAGGGRCGKLAPGAVGKLRAAGLDLDVVETRVPGDATRLARQAYAAGCTQFIAVGGDGTSCEVVNGLFPEAANGPRPVLGFLPLGSGNSFLRDFSARGAGHALEAIRAGRRQPCDVLRATHAGGTLYFMNLLSMGFAADVAFERAGRFRRWGELGYLLAVFTCLIRLDRRAFPVRADEEDDFDRRRCLFLSFNNSKFTGGKMMIAPGARTDDGLIEYVRWGPIGRLGLLANLPRLFTGTHIRHRMAERRGARRIEFALDRPVNIMLDGEVLQLQCRNIDVLAGALDVMV